MQEVKFYYYVIVRETKDNSGMDFFHGLEFKLTELQFRLFPLDVFIDLGLSVAVQKVEITEK